MKKISAFILAACFFNSLPAQNIIREKQAGLFVESQILSSSPYIWDRGFGLLYRYSNKPNKALRFQLVYKNKGYNEGTTLFSMVNDTIKETTLQRSDNNFYIGAGIEKQRHFYKKIYLYAALDARLGYGFSTYSSNSAYKAYNSSTKNFTSYYFETNQLPFKYESHRYMFDILPSIGAKIARKKMGLTLEMGLNLQSTYSSSTTGNHLRMYDVSLIGFINRIGFYYKF